MSEAFRLVAQELYSQECVFSEKLPISFNDETMRLVKRTTESMRKMKKETDLLLKHVIYLKVF